MMAPEFLERVAFVTAFPPCTHLAVSGARWFKGKGLRKLADSIHMFATAAEFFLQKSKNKLDQLQRLLPHLIK